MAEKRVFEPKHDRVLIRPIEQEAETGILIPEACKEESLVGVVIAAGPGRLLDSGTWHNVQTFVGDEVMFGKFAGTDVFVNGETLRLVREEEILGTFRPRE